MLDTLDTLDDADKRGAHPPSSTAKSSATAPARRVYHGNRGELAAGCREGQKETLGALGPVLNVVAPWNATTIQAAVAPLEAEDHRPDPADPADPRPRLAAAATGHIAVLGRSSFTLPEAVADGETPPLRKPASE